MTSVKNGPGGNAALLRAHPLFTGLPAADLDRLAASSVRFDAAAGQVLFHEGDPVRHVPLLESGRVRVSRHDDEGGEKVFGQFAEGEFIALAAAFMNRGCFPMTALVLADSRMTLVPADGLRALCRAHPDLAMRLLNRFAERLHEAVERVDRMTARSASERLADDLLRLSEAAGGLTVALPLARAQWAATLGMRYETLSRILSAWKRQGIVSTSRALLEIKDFDRLRELAGPEREP